MKKLLLFLILFLPSICFSQAGRYDGIAINNTGSPIGGVTVTVCSPGSGTNPCTGTAIIYSNRAMTQLSNNPFTADNIGNYGFYARPGRYDISFTGTGLNPFTLVDQIVSPDPASIFTDLLPTTNNLFNLGSNSFRWNVFANNSNITTATIGTANITTLNAANAPWTSPMYLNGLVFPGEFPGADGTAKQDTAIAAVSPGPRTLIDTTDLASGNASSYPNAIPIIDLRQSFDFIINKASNADRVGSVLLENDLGDFTTRPLTGTFTLTNGSSTVTGVGTHFTTELGGGSGGSMLRLSADCSTCWSWVSSITDDTHLTLGANYTGAGGNGSAVSTVTTHPFVIRRVVNTAVSPSSGVGEAGGLSIIEIRQTGNRDLYGSNNNISYYTAATHTNGNAIATELDVSNFSGVDDDTGTSTLGLDVLSAGTNHPNTAIQVLATDPTNNGWRRGAFITGFAGGVGLQIQGSQDLAQFLPTANDTNKQIGGRLADDSAYSWSVDNSGNASFTSSHVSVWTASQTFTDPVTENAPAIANATDVAIAGDNAQVESGLYGQAWIGASNTKNWTSTCALRGLIGQTKVVAGSSGTITGAAAIVANPIVEPGATVTTQYGLFVLAPTGGGTITNKVSVGTEVGAGVENIPDGYTTAGQYTSTVGTGTAPMVVSSTTPVNNFTGHALVYNHSGTQIVNPHTSQDRCTLGTDCAVTFTGGAVFADTSYICQARDATTAANAVTINKVSASQVTFTGTGTDIIEYSCVGR